MTDGAITTTYDFAMSGELRSVDDGTTTIDDEHDPFGRRLGKSVDGGSHRAFSTRTPSTRSPSHTRTRTMLGLLSVLMLAGCYIPGSEKEHESTVFANRSPNWENERLVDQRWVGDPAMSMLRTNDLGQPFEVPLDEIGGFKPRWGVEYRVRFRSRQPILNYLEIGDTELTLIDVVEEIPRPGATFRLHSIGAPWFGSDRRAFRDGQRFSCSSPMVCDALDQRLREEDHRFDLLMKHGTNPGTLEVLGVEDRTCVTLSECREPPTHQGGDICCRGECMPSKQCVGDPWG